MHSAVAGDDRHAEVSYLGHRNQAAFRDVD
jgi:hypothetical protein